MPRTPPMSAFADRPDELAPVLAGGLAGLAAAAAAALAGTGGLLVATTFALLGLAVGAALARPAILLAAFVALLPLHLPALVLLFNAGIDHGAIRGFSAWKELVALAFLGVLVARQVVRGALRPIRVLDAVVLAFLALNLLYLVAPPQPAPFVARAQGFRDNTFFVFLYFIGRLAPMRLSGVRAVAAVAIATGVLGVFAGVYERLFLPLEFFFDPLHFDDFMRDYLNLHYHTGIPFNFWTSTGTMRRGVSFYLGSHHFAMASVLLFPLVLAVRRPLRTFPASFQAPLLACLTVGLALPLTRSVMLACLLQVLVIGWVTRRPHYVVATVLGVVLLLGMSTAFLDLSGYATAVVSSPQSSLSTHLRSWGDTVAIVGDNLLGVGFGVVDTAAERAGGGQPGVLGGEGEYAFTATSLGIPGLVLFVVLQVVVVTTLLRTYRSSDDPGMRQLALVTLAMFVGCIAAGIFTQLRHVPAVLFPVWWLVGAVARGSLAEEPGPRREDGAPARVPGPPRQSGAPPESVSPPESAPPQRAGPARGSGRE